MANTRDPSPPLPFGSPQQYKEELANVQARGRVTPVTPAYLDSVGGLRDLLGKKIYSEVSIRGNIGTQAIADDGEAERARMGRARTPFVLTCQEWLSAPYPRYIVASVNPSEVQWRLAQRAAAQKTRVGEIVHYWRDRFRNTYYDEPQLTITFQSGNIMPIRQNPPIKQTVATSTAGQFVTESLNVGVRYVTDESETTPQVPPGLANFYEFIELVDTQKVLDSGDCNYIYIMYNSRLFANMTLAGLFTPEGMSWADSANDPNQVNSWTANFTVYDSFPRLNDRTALLNMFQQAGWGRI